MSHWDDGYYGTQEPKPRKPEPVESTNQWAGLTWWTSIFDTERRARQGDDMSHLLCQHCGKVHEAFCCMEGERHARMTELDAVMVSVDKWFDADDPRLENNPATRAADAREIGLRAIEYLTAELATVKAERDELLSEKQESRQFKVLRENMEMKAELTRLRGYVQHKPECAMTPSRCDCPSYWCIHKPNFGDGCTCGLRGEQKGDTNV